MNDRRSIGKHRGRALQQRQWGQGRKLRVAVEAEVVGVGFMTFSVDERHVTCCGAGKRLSLLIQAGKRTKTAKIGWVRTKKERSIHCVGLLLFARSRQHPPSQVGFIPEQRSKRE